MCNAAIIICMMCNKNDKNKVTDKIITLHNNYDLKIIVVEICSTINTAFLEKIANHVLHTGMTSINEAEAKAVELANECGYGNLLVFNLTRLE